VTHHQEHDANRRLTGPSQLRHDPTQAVLALAYTKLAFDLNADPLIKALLPSVGLRLCRILSGTA